MARQEDQEKRNTIQRIQQYVRDRLSRQQRGARVKQQQAKAAKAPAQPDKARDFWAEVGVSREEALRRSGLDEASRQEYGSFTFLGGDRPQAANDAYRGRGRGADQRPALPQPGLPPASREWDNAPDITPERPQGENTLDHSRSGGTSLSERYPVSPESERQPQREEEKERDQDHER